MENRLTIKKESTLKIIFDKIKNLYQFDQSIGEAFNMYLLFITLAKNNKIVNNNAQIALNAQSEDLLENKAMNFFKMNTASIEIYFQDKLNIVFFPVHPACRNLSKLTRRELMQEVKRDTPQDKIMVNKFN